jgi:hypothetical protein
MVNLKKKFFSVFCSLRGFVIFAQNFSKWRIFFVLKLQPQYVQ